MLLLGLFFLTEVLEGKKKIEIGKKPLHLQSWKCFSSGLKMWSLVGNCRNRKDVQGQNCLFVVCLNGMAWGRGKAKWF